MNRKKIVLLALFSFAVGMGIAFSLNWPGSSKVSNFFQTAVPSPVSQAPVTPELAPASGTAFPNFIELVKKIEPAVVNISTTKVFERQTSPFPGLGQQDPFFDEFFGHFFGGRIPQQQQKQSSRGSGFIINKEGHILTNNHVVDGVDEIVVTLFDKRELKAKVVGTDPKTDLAVIKIEGSDDLPTIPLGNSDALEIGEWVLAIGNPFGLGQTVTAGIVSAKGRVIGAGPYDDFIQTDASINPGNSGGPLFNLRGEVVGVNSAIIASGQGIGFAIPINMAKGLIPQLISQGKVTRAWVGVSIADVTEELAGSFKLADRKGALVVAVYKNSPADKVGLKPGDLIRELNGKPIQESRDLPAQVALLPVGASVELVYLREGKSLKATMVLGNMEDSEKSAEKEEGLGLTVRTLFPEELGEHDLPAGAQGVIVVLVDRASLAARAGVRPGDLILEMNGKPVNDAKQFGKLVSGVKEGEMIRLYVKRAEATLLITFPK